MIINGKWNKRYMKLASDVAQWSKDPSSQIGAVAISSRGQVLSTGYNGFPRNIEDTEERLNDRTIKYSLIVHAEMNMIFNATYNGVSLDNSTVFVAGLPCCSQCALGIIQVGVKHVVMNGDPDNARWSESAHLALDLFDEAGVTWEFTANE